MANTASKVWPSRQAEVESRSNGSPWMWGTTDSGGREATSWRPVWKMVTSWPRSTRPFTM
jgi:hypothetical protein